MLVCLFQTGLREQGKKSNFIILTNCITYISCAIDSLDIYVRFMDNITNSTSSTANKTSFDKQRNGFRAKLSTHALVSWDIIIFVLKCNFI